MNSDGTTWFAEATRSASFILQPSNTIRATGGSTGGTGGAGSTGSSGGGGSGTGDDSNAGTGGGGRRPPVVVAEPTQPEKPSNTGGDIPKDPVINLPEVSPPAAPVDTTKSFEPAIIDTRHAAAPDEHERSFNVVGLPVRSPGVSVEPAACPPETMHGAAFDHVQSCTCTSATSCCTRIVSYLGYVKWVILILLLVCADLLAIVILLIGKVRLLEERVLTKPARRPRNRKKA